MRLARACGGVGVLVLALTGVTAHAAQAAPPVNDKAADAVVVPAIPSSIAADLTEATVDVDDAALDARCGEVSTGSVWFLLTPAYDTLLGYSANNDAVRVDVATGGPGAMELRACLWDLYDGYPVDAGTTYYVRVAATGSGVPPGTELRVDLLDVACNGRSDDDFDGDGCPDMAVGAPASALGGVPAVGTVEVAYGNGYNSFAKRRQLLDPRAYGVGLQTGAGFGATLTHGWLDDDRYTDLVIGIPRLDVGAAQDSGAVLVLFGSPDGLGDSHVLLRQGSVPGSGGREAGDLFGSALDVEDHQLVVGSPGEDIGDLADAGAVVAFSGFTAGRAPSTARVISQAGAVAGRVETGDRCGHAVTIGPRGMTVVGCPGEDVGSLNSAGAVVTIARNGTSAAFTQDSAGMAGVAEVGDRLGTAVAYLPDPFDDGYRLALGAPGEDIAGIPDAGLVNFLLASAQTSTPRPQAWAVGQGTAGVSGVPEPGDRFGSVLATWSAFHAIDLLVGVPDEDIGGATDAGAVTSIHLEWVGSGSQPVVGRSLTQATPRVAGTPEAGDRLGAALSTTGADPDDDDGAYDTVYAGVPGEDTGGIADVGFVQALTYPATTISPTDAASGQRFGAALSRSW